MSATTDALIISTDQHQRAQPLLRAVDAHQEKARALLDRARASDAQLGLPSLSARPTPIPPSPTARPPASYPDLLAAAQARQPLVRHPSDLVPPDLRRAAHARHRNLQRQVRATRALTPTEVAAASLAGLLSGLIHSVFFAFPPQPGLPGSPGSQWVREQINGLVTDGQRRQWERYFHVPYDAPHSGFLQNIVQGLYPDSHRLHTPGHDPLLGFIFGVRDLLTGQMTAIDATGKVIINQVGHGLPLFEALLHQLMHLASDVTTPRGLPAPLFGLLQFIQAGSFGPEKHTVAQITSAMYRANYDFRHVLASSLPVLLTELLVRAIYLILRLKAGVPLRDALPFGNKPALQRMLLIAHGTACAWNTGHLVLTKSPLVINAPQWVAFARYAAPEVLWQVHGQRQAVHRLAQADLTAYLQDVAQRLDGQSRFVM